MKKEYEQQIKALYEISKAITSEMYLDDILKLIVVVTAQVLHSKICSIMLVDEKNQTIQVKATQYLSEEYIKKPPLKIGEGIAGKVVQSGKPIVVKDVRERDDYKYKDLAIKEGIVSMLCVPMIVKKKVIGVLNIYTETEHSFTKDEIEILSLIANQAAVAIENTELMVKTKVIQEELETRKKIEKAKGILMKEQNLTEEQAYNKIRRYSMDTRKSMREIAEAIILTHEIKTEK